MDGRGFDIGGKAFSSAECDGDRLNVGVCMC